MNTALTDCESAIRALALVEVVSCPNEALRDHAIGVQHLIDQITIVHAGVLAEAERRAVWFGTGARNLAEWLAGKTQCNTGSTNKKARLGKNMGKNKQLDEAVKKGELSPDAAAELCDALESAPAGADPAELVEAVKGATPKEARDAASKWKDINSTTTPEELEEERYQRRSVRPGVSEDGMETTIVTLPTLQSREFRNVIGFLGGKPSATDTRSTAQRLADGLIELCSAYAKGEVHGGREKPTILIHIREDAFNGRSDEPGWTGHGDRIPAHVVRRLAEDADLQLLISRGHEILHLGRNTRYASTAQYKALLVRDGGCRWPGCDIPAAWCDVDHLIPWEHGGPTDLDNLVLWCRHHHTEKHRPGVRVTGDATTTRVTLADGTALDCTLATRERERQRRQPGQRPPRRSPQPAAA